ncbi:hypothetical protein CSC70_00755 [Pseudoxanthomonas kalamensis DSM 18571]|uniref:PH domain-containing protein n=1 Tax=Pseudoxanthomonas kalamensis TaxID=289483 RepID=UPI0013907747|nr:PH domain-containing protein [Pseudoxanthomonas kalamensis]KAF1712094.1 hypothetical protein CSC70_00755 [Pseudoxanthomonas kalamensis DSM 18571]
MSSVPVPPASASSPPELPQSWDREEWHPLPPRGAVFAALGNAIGWGLPGVGIGLALVLPLRLPLWMLLLPALAGAAFGAWIGWKRHRRTRWKLDEDGFAVQHGHWWFRETRVPASRVQHLDLKRGPLERWANLATLVIHTAGTRMAAVPVGGLDANDAEWLRDRLARQLDEVGDAL